VRSLDHKRALIVGAGSGIGRGVFDAFRAAGASVGALEIDPAKCSHLADANDGPVVQGDATVYRDNEVGVAAMVDAYGGLDVLVNCVGVFDFYLGLDEIDSNMVDGALTEAMTTNVGAHLLSVKASLEQLRLSKGSIILTCSTSSFTAGRGGILYVASKFALRGCVLSLADELAPDVRVNGVAPGGTVGTDLRGLRSLGLGDRSLGETPDRADSITARSPLGVALNPDDHAQSYVFLASDAARGMTGRFLHPDGGANLGRV
jgi:NAD(P)-dependent dehydrogenase (short-subunit alcohol dehydrogenase family)